ncbi:MAG: Na/Pi cotransporter family protein [Lachnospiraceae bacterium]|jgi:phosphate:Na+ symporter|nr:Na/Pi cotransporter family protein [Lachnospiraceae bacterium]
MDILSILQLLGGVGLFLYGMSLMGSSLEKLAGSGLEKILEKLTTGKNKAAGYIKGWGLGTGVSAIIQSSAATTIMLIGFVNAGIMKLVQAIPVIMGANVGSTVTTQILRLGDLGSDNILIQLIKPASFAPMLVGIGAFIVLFTKNKKAKQAAGILVGLGVLFYGMTTMEAVFAPLKDSPTFQKAFVSFNNPFIGILVGLVITALIQSSNASIGILQALSATGSVTYACAFPILVGANLGKCMTTILGGIGGNKKAKRLVLAYILFNLFGAIIFSTIIYLIYYTVGIGFWNDSINRGGIANIHLLFNLLTSIILLPFSQKISNLTEIIIVKEKVSKSDKELAVLDNMLLNTPTIALEQCKQVISSMADAIYENYKIATGLIYNYDESKHEKLLENEDFIDRCESALSAYIVKINSKRLSKDNRLVVSEILNSISDFERMGDHCMNIYFVARDKNEQNINFSPAGHFEVDTITNAVDNILKTTFDCFKNDNASAAVRIEPMAETIDNLKEIIKTHHVERLQEGICGIAGGISLVDLVTSYERISSHCANVSLHIVKRVENDHNFDEMHGHANDSFSEEYKALVHYYEMQYISPVINEKQSLEAEQKYREEHKEEFEDKKNDKTKQHNKPSDKIKAKLTDKKSDKDKTKSNDKAPDKNKVKTSDKTTDKDKAKTNDKAINKDNKKAVDKDNSTAKKSNKKK